MTMCAVNNSNKSSKTQTSFLTRTSMKTQLYHGSKTSQCLHSYSLCFVCMYIYIYIYIYIYTHTRIYIYPNHQIKVTEKLTDGQLIRTSEIKHNDGNII